MRVKRGLCIAVSLLTGAGCAERGAEPLDLLGAVDPLIGTGGLGFGYGAMNPAATAPFGMVKLGPDTTDSYGAVGYSHTAGYFYDDPYVQAFSHTRLPGIGATDGGALGFMPAAAATMDRDLLRAPMDHDLERASPGCYALSLDGLAEVVLVATPRAGQHSYTWLGEGERWLNIDLGHTLADDHEVWESQIALGEREISGYVLMGGSLTGRGDVGLPTWFVARFDRDWEEEQLWLERAPAAGDWAEGVQTGVSLRFEGGVQVKVGISSVDLEGARANLEAELPGWDQAAALERTRALWAEALAPIEVSGGGETEGRIFATALYHAMQLPTLFTDVDRRYRGLDGAVHEAATWDYYTDFSLWDTYRTFHPLMLLAWPERAADMMRSLVDMGERLGGWLPRWPAGITESGSMIGNSADIVLGEALVKGVDDWPVEAGLAMATAQATERDRPGARDELPEYMSLGYVPYDLADASAAKTLEYAIDDAALAAWHASMGEDEAAAHFAWRSRSYRNVFDPDVDFVRGRKGDGGWAPLEHEGWGEAFAEGNAWQYTWLAPHDALGLAELFGDREMMLWKLGYLFEQSAEQEDTWLPDAFYWHGNEPDIHAAFLFAELGRPAQTQHWVRWVREAKYADSPEGLDGNDDGGTLSSWYVLAAVGLYPMNGTDRYVLTTPIFDRVTIDRPGGALVIEATGRGDYLAGASLDGVPLERASLRHSQLVGGRRLLLERSEAPTDWGRW